MAEVEFIYNGEKIIIQCNLNDKMKDIFNKYIIKLGIEINSVYFLYGGNIIKEDLILEEIISNEDKKRNKMNIIVNQINKNEEKKLKIKSKEIICPQCGEWRMYKNKYK